MGNIIFGKEEDCRPESANISYRSIEDDIMEECRRKLLQRKSQRDNLIAKNREWKLEDQRKIEQRWEAVIGKWERIYNKDCNNTAKNFFCDRVSILLGRYRTERQNELDASAKWYDDQIRKFGEDYENYKRELGEECRNLCTIEIPPLTASSSKPRPMSDETFATVAAIAGDVGFHLGESITEVMLNNGKSKSNIGPYIISSKGSGKVSASKEKVEITGDVQSHIRKDKKKSSTQFLQEIQFIANNSIVRSPNTEYLINTSEGSTEVCVIEGLVIVSPLNVECNEIEVSAGECITINAQGNISDYYSLDIKKEENWWEGWPLITGIDDDEIREIDGGGGDEHTFIIRAFDFQIGGTSVRAWVDDMINEMESWISVTE